MNMELTLQCMHELLTDGVDGWFEMDFEDGCGASMFGFMESNMFSGEPACYNEVDLEGSYVEDVSLIFREIHHGDFPCQHVALVHPRVVVWGNLGEAPQIPTPEPTRDMTVHMKPSIGFLALAVVAAVYQ